MTVSSVAPASAPVSSPPATGGWRSRVCGLATSPSVQKNVLSVMDQAVVSGASFVSSVLIGRLCAPDDLGLYALAMSLLLAARGIQSEVVSAPYLIYCHRRQDQSLAAYTGSSFLHLAAFALLTMLAIGGFAWSSSAAGTANFLPIFGSLALVVPFVLLREHQRQVSFAHLKLATALALDVVVTVVQLGSLAVLAWYGQLSVPAVLGAMGLGTLLANGAWFFLRETPIRYEWQAAGRDWRENWQFCRWTLASHLLARVMTYAAPWVVAATYGDFATGLMAACTTIVNLLGMFVTGISNFLTPRAARAYATEGIPALRRVLTETLWIFVVPVGLFCIFLAITGDWLVRLVYGDQFHESHLLLWFLALQLLANTVGITAGNGLWAIDRPRDNFLADVVTFFTTIVAMALLLPVLGAAGAAGGLFFGTVCGSVMRVMALRASLQILEAKAAGAEVSHG